MKCSELIGRVTYAARNEPSLTPFKESYPKYINQLQMVGMDCIHNYFPLNMLKMTPWNISNICRFIVFHSSRCKYFDSSGWEERAWFQRPKDFKRALHYVYTGTINQVGIYMHVYILLIQKDETVQKVQN